MSSRKRSLLRVETVKLRSCGLHPEIVVRFACATIDRHRKFAAMGLQRLGMSGKGAREPEGFAKLSV